MPSARLYCVGLFILALITVLLAFPQAAQTAGTDFTTPITRIEVRTPDTGSCDVVGSANYNCTNATKITYRLSCWDQDDDCTTYAQVGTNPPTTSMGTCTSAQDFSGCTESTITINYNDPSTTLYFYSVDTNGNAESVTTITHSFVFTLTGHVYVDPNHNCTGATGYSGATITLNGSSTTTASDGSYSLTTSPRTSLTATLTKPAGYDISTCSGATYQNDYPPAQTHDFYITQYTFSGHIYIDPGHDCTGTTPYTLSDAKVTNNGIEQNPDGNGAFSFPGEAPGHYTATLTAPPNYQISPCPNNTNPTSFGYDVPATAQNSSNSPDQTHDFYITLLYNATGSETIDYNHDCTFNNISPYGQDVNYSGTPTVASTGGTVNTSSGGNFTITSIQSGTYTVSLTVPSGYQIVCATVAKSDGTIVSTVSTNSTSLTVPPDAQNIIFYITPLYSISGNVFVDYDHDGVYESAYDAGYNSSGTAIVTITSGPSSGSSATNSNLSPTANFTLSNLISGDYQVTLTVPSGYQATFTNPVTFTALASNTTNVQLGITPLYSIAGNIYIDANKNDYFDGASLGGPDKNYTATTTTLSVTGLNPAPGGTTGTTTLVSNPSCPVDSTGQHAQICTSNGVYTTGATLVSGEYQVAFTVSPLPDGWTTTMPAGSPPYYDVYVGKSGLSSPYSCDPGTTNTQTQPRNAAVCDGTGNLSGVNFGMNDDHIHIHCTGSDCLCQPGSADCPWGPLCDPTTDPTCQPTSACPLNDSNSGPMSNTPGILFPGSTTPDFGGGQAAPNPDNWVVGGSSWPEVFAPVNSNVIRTSFDYLLTTAKQSGITVTDLVTSNTCSNLNNCTLPANLNNGIYYSSGDLTLNAYTFSANKNFVLLVNGNLTITGKLLVPVGSSLLISTSGDIHVLSSVGETSQTTCDPTTQAQTGCDIEGIFSADGSFYEDGTNDCTKGPDLRLNIAGSVIVNAGQTGGRVKLNRDLCQDDICPTLDITERPDFALNAPQFVRHPNFVWKEVAP